MVIDVRYASLLVTALNTIFTARTKFRRGSQAGPYHWPPLLISTEETFRYTVLDGPLSKYHT
jgi:hypothetical protein